MALTLLEAAKLVQETDLLTSAFMDLYAGSSSILENLPWRTIAGNALTYNIEEQYPGVGFRGVNESWTASTGIINQKRESLTITGGEIEIDTFILNSMGMEQRTVQERMKVKALSLAWTDKFFNGDVQSNPREFDGLKTRIVGNQKIAAGNTANGTPLSLAVLDRAIDQVEDPTHIIMNRNMRRLFSVAQRTSNVAGNITFSQNDIGRPLMFYNGLPILTVDLNNVNSAILPFTETCTSGTATGTSIYVVSFGELGVCGLQNGTMRVTDLGELQSKPAVSTRIEWYTGLAIFDGRAAARIWSISNAAITA